MKKTTLAAVASVLLVLSACSSNDGSTDEPTATKTVTETATPTPTETPEPEPEPESQMSGEDILLEAVFSEYPEVEGQMSDTDIIGLADAACEAFDAGAPVEDVVGILLDTSGGNKDILEFQGFIIGAGTVALCPEHEEMVQDYINSTGGSNL